MNPNYHAWEVKIGDFFDQKTDGDKLRFLLKFAALAPSGHNTQPWNFSVEKGEILAWINHGRSLEGSDPERHQLLIAFGCMLENLLVAGDYYGFEEKIAYFPDQTRSDLIARISFTTKSDTKKNSPDSKLISSITKRSTNRSKYSDRGLPQKFLDEIGEYQDKNLKIFTITDNSEKSNIADIVIDAQIEAMESTSFREELSHYIKSSFTKEHFGMPGFVLEIPAPISIFAHHLIKRFNLSKQNRKKDDTLFKKHTPAFIVIGSSKNSPENWLKAGGIFEKIWLKAASEGLSCSPFAGVIQSSFHAGQLKKILNTDLEPQVFFRIGYAEREFRHTPRFPLDQLIKH